MPEVVAKTIDAWSREVIGPGMVKCHPEQSRIEDVRHRDHHLSYLAIMLFSSETESHGRRRWIIRWQFAHTSARSSSEVLRVRGSGQVPIVLTWRRPSPAPDSSPSDQSK